MMTEQDGSPSKRVRLSENAPGDDVMIMAQGHHRLGLVDDPSKLSATWRMLPAESTIFEWPSRTPKSLSEVDPVHAAVYANIREAQFAVKVCTPVVAAIAKSKQGFRCLSQSDVPFYEAIACCESVDGAADALRSKPSARALLIRNEACICVFAPIVDAVFTLSYSLDRCCRKQLLVGTRSVIEPNDEVFKHASTQIVGDFCIGVEWEAAKAWVANSPPQEIGGGKNESPEVKEKRNLLAKAHKEFAKRRMDELIWNHISAKIEDGWLITPGDRFWSQVEPASLKSKSTNVTADILHSAVYSSTSMQAVVHSHTPAIEAVSCLEEGFTPVIPAGSEFIGRVAYHPWEGFSTDSTECDRITLAILAVPECHTLIARNHGAFTFGRSVDEAVQRHVALDAACREQLLNGCDANVALEELSKLEKGQY